MYERNLKKEIEELRKDYKEYNNEKIILFTLATLVANHRDIDFSTQSALRDELYSRLNKWVTVQ